MTEAQAKGGRARAAALSSQERRDIAAAAAKARWHPEALPTHQPEAHKKRLERAKVRAKAVMLEFAKIGQDATAAATALGEVLKAMEKKPDA